jgi:hypothetical protein
MPRKARSELFGNREADGVRKLAGFLPAVVLGVASVILEASPSFSAPITYTEEATASGSLGGVAFTNADVVFRMTGDTANVINGIFSFATFSNRVTGTVSVSGGAPAILTNPIGVFASQPNQEVGFFEGVDGSFAFGNTSIRNASFST